MVELEKNNVSRKAMLGGSVAAGAALLVPTERVAAAGSGPGTVTAVKEPLRPSAITFFKDPSFNYNVLGLCGAVVGRRPFTRLPDEESGEEADANGQQQSAGSPLRR
jgi:hypothetical protein